MTHTAPSPPAGGYEPPHSLILPLALVLYRYQSEVAALGIDPPKLAMLDLDDESTTDGIPENDRMIYLRHLLGGDELRESDVGEPQSQFDRIAHVLMEDFLVTRLPGCVVVGEEATPAKWDEAQAAPPGTLIVVLDAIDGSMPHESVAFGYSTNLLLYRKNADGTVSLILMIMVTDSGRMLAWLAPSRVGAAHLTHSDPYTGVPTVIEPLEPVVSAERVRAGTVAVVGRDQERRSYLAPLFSGGLSVITLGGAPAMAGLLLGDLETVVIPEPQTIWDAAPLLALSAGMGINFVTITENRVLTDSEVRTMFNKIDRPAPGKHRPVPAMVVSRNRFVAAQLARALHRHWAANRPIDDDIQQ